MLVDIASALQVPLTDVICPHFLRVRPIGDLPHVENLIVQMRGDIAPASSEQLVLQDLIIHHHGSADISLAPQSTDRRVLKIQSQVTRTHVLQYAHVNNYCEFVRNRCLVQINHALWPLQDAAQRHLQHGTYVCVVLPPPETRQHDVLRTIQITEEFGDLTNRPSFEEMYPKITQAKSPSPLGGGSTTADASSGTTPNCGLSFPSKFQDDGNWHLPLLEHFNDEDQSSPPRFDRDVENINAFNVPNVPFLPEFQNLHRFRLQLQSLFEEYAVVDFPDQGPVLHVVTWYIHHDLHTSCLMSRTVQLEADPMQWPQALCAPWLHLVQAFQPLAFRDVTPAPLRRSTELPAPHVILEQGLHRQQYAALISTLIQGQHHDGTFHRAVSIPREISAEDIVRSVGLERRCAVYRCTAWSGIQQFQPTVREEVFSGIGILLHVHEARLRHQLNDNDRDHPFWHPQREAPSASTAIRAHQEVGDSSHTSASSGFRQALAQAPSPHEDGLFRPDLLTAWHTFLAGTTHRPVQFLVVSWFCDHFRLPRSVDSRVVQLPIDADGWKSTLLEAWSDWVLPGIAVEFYVVQPEPPGEATPIVAHIILAQNQLPEHISALISTTAEGDDPWVPSRRVVKLPRVVDHWTLVHEGGLMHMCPPFAEHLDCRSWIGAQELTDGHLRISFSGDGFLVIAASAWHDHIQHYDPDIVRIDQLFHDLSGLISALVSKVCHPDVINLDAQAVWLNGRHSCSEAEGEVTPAHFPPPDAYKGGHVPAQYESICTSLSQHQGLDIAMIEPLLRLAHTHPRFAADGHECFLHAHVWFVDHLRFPVCSSGRIICLTLPSHSWSSQVLSAWSDCLDPFMPIRLHVVPPNPASDLQDVHVHVVLSQNVVPQMVSTLFEIPVEERKQHWHGDSSPFVVAATSQQLSSNCMPIAARQCLEQKFQQCPIAFELAILNDFALNPEPARLQFGDRLIARPVWFDPSWAHCTDKEFATCLQQQLDSKSVPVDGNLAVPVPGKFPVPICLDAVIPSAVVSSGELDPNISALGWFQQNDWYEHCRSFPVSDPFPLPDGLKIPAVSYHSLLAPPLETPVSQWQWEVYVDGSVGQTQAGWSVIIVSMDGSHSCFYGCFAGQVQLAPNAPDWYGATEIDNIAAELTAFIVAQDVIWRRLPSRQAVLRPDLLLSQLIATHEAISSASPKLAQLSRILSRWIGPEVTVSKVAAHDNHPWNELADSLAKCASAQASANLLTWESPGLHQLAKEPHDLAWCWLQDTSEAFSACFPPLLQQEVMQFPLSLHKVAQVPQVADSPVSWLNLEFQVATANVLALDSFDHQTEVGRQAGVRTQRLDHQMHAARIAVLGIQEARSKPGQYRSDHYTIFASGFQGPRPVCLGCELWLHRHLPLATHASGRSLCFGDFKALVQVADPRRLFVRLEAEGLVLQFIVLHTPCLGKSKGDGDKPIDCIASWWCETQEYIRQHVQTDLVWVMVDANSPISDLAAPFADTYGAEKMNQQGELFAKFLLECRLFAPSTFASIHVGSHDTWTHSSGKSYRRDYVLVSEVVFGIAGQSQVMRDFDTTFCHEDHLPVRFAVNGIIPDRSTVDARVVWDEAAFLCPDRIKAFQQALATLPVPKWHVQVEAHKDWYEKQLFQLGAQFFSKTTQKRKRPTLSSTTLDMIAMKRHFLDCARAWGEAQSEAFKEFIKPIEKLIRAAVKADLSIFYDQLLVQLQNSGSLGDHKIVFRTLTRLGRKSSRVAAGPRPLPMLKKEDGSLTSTFLERQNVWMKKFSALEAGQQMSWDTLARLDRPSPFLPLDLPEAASFPSVWDIQEGLRKIKRGKAPGPNGLPPALLKAGGEIFARQFLALLTKCVAHSHEPLSWKGGRLYPLHKGKMHPSEPEGYRSIFISDYTAKLYHMTLRRPLEQIWNGNMHSLQLGGRKGQGTDIAHHLLQSFLHWSFSKRMSAAVVFFDVRAAFYSVIREALFEGDGNLPQLSEALQRLGIDLAHILQIVASVDSDFALEGLSPHMLSILKDVMTNTHFVVDGLPSPCRTRKGTRPGDPIGDILYNLVMSVLLRDAKTYIAEHSDLQLYGNPAICADFTSHSAPPSCGAFDVSFVDDCAFGIHAPEIAEVSDAIKAVVESMVFAAKRRGLEINFEDGKTEAIWQIVGRGSRRWKTELATNGSAIRWVSSFGPVALRVVPAYRHLGTWLQTGIAHAKEIAHRGAQARATWGALTWQFYAKSYVSLHAKTTIFLSTAYSQFLYNCHVWTGVLQKDWDRWQNMLRKPVCLMIRGQLRGVNPLHIDMEEACGLAGILPPKFALQVARLRYLKRLTLHCPQTLWNIIFDARDHDGSWLQSCTDAFEWFRKYYDVPFAPITNQLADWMLVISTDASWKGRLKRAAYSCIQHCKARAEQHVFQLRFETRYVQIGGILPVTDQPVVEKWQCDLCNRCFPSRRGLAVHSARSHGYKRIERYFASGDVCDACGKLFHARARLLSHLYECTTCFTTLQACFPPMAEETVTELDDIDTQYAVDMRKQGWWTTKAFLPPLKIAGPLLPSAGTESAHVFHQRWMIRTPNPGTLFQELQGRQQGRQPDEQPEVKLFENDFPAFIFQAPPGPNQGSGILDQGSLARETAILHIRWFVFVHFFSGYRRTNDLHSVLQQSPMPDGSQMIVISVDLCMQKRDGNLASDHATSWWINRIRSGQIFGAGGGPPCESFSAARFLPDGPRPLRTGTHPSGLPALSRREWSQVTIGSRLLYFIFEILLELAVLGGCAFLEHPQWPLWALAHDPASIWSFQAARLCRLLRCFSVVSFDQCLYDSVARKPTTILLLRLDSFRHETLSRGFGGRCNHGRDAHEGLKGHTERGEFKTAVGKIYPSGLNISLGRAIRQFAISTFGNEPPQAALPEELFCYTQQIFAADEVVQPDFHAA